VWKCIFVVEWVGGGGLFARDGRMEVEMERGVL
jgi:hypothetical protein